MSDSPAPGGTAADVVPAGASTIPVVDVRHGMFGVARHRRHLRLRRPGPAPSSFPAPSARVRTAAGSTRSPTRWSARLDAEGSRTATSIEAVVVDRGEITFHVRREHLRRVRPAAARRARAALRALPGRQRRPLPRTTTGRELHAVYHLLSMTHNRRIRLEVSVPDADPHVPCDRLGLPDQRLARARDVRHVRHRLRRPPGADPDPDARRLGRATRSARTTRSAASPSSTRARPIPPPDERRSYS